MKAILLIGLILLSGCGAGFFSARTKAEFAMPDGTLIKWDSEKEQHGLKASFEKTKDGATKANVEVEKAITPEQAIASAAAANEKMLGMLNDMYQTLLPLLAALGKAAATKGAIP